MAGHRRYKLSWSGRQMPTFRLAPGQQSADLLWCSQWEARQNSAAHMTHFVGCASWHVRSGTSWHAPCGLGARPPWLSRITPRQKWGPGVVGADSQRKPVTWPSPRGPTSCLRGWHPCCFVFSWTDQVKPEMRSLRYSLAGKCNTFPILTLVEGEWGPHYCHVHLGPPGDISSSNELVTSSSPVSEPYQWSSYPLIDIFTLITRFKFRFEIICQEINNVWPPTIPPTTKEFL